MPLCIATSVNKGAICAIMNNAINQEKMLDNRVAMTSARGFAWEPMVSTVVSSSNTNSNHKKQSSRAKRAIGMGMSSLPSAPEEERSDSLTK